MGSFFALPVQHARSTTTPDAISGLVFWLDAGVGVTAPGNVVSDWTDQSSGGHDGTGVGSPTLVSSALNGLPAVAFGGGQKLTFSNVTARTVFVVYKDDGTVQDYADILGTNGVGEGAPFHGETAVSGILVSPTFASANVLNGAAYVNGTSATPGNIAVSTSFKIYSFVTTASVTFDNFAQNQGQANRYRKGKYAEVIGYSGALSDADRMAVENYLSSKYAITVPFVAGTISATSLTNTSINLSSTAPSGGNSSSYAYQWYESTSSGFTPGEANLVSGATASTLSLTDLTPSTAYYFKVGYTDADASSTVSDELAVFTYTPANVSGLDLWFSGTLGITKSSNFVSSWLDESGGGHDATQATGANQPTYVSSGLNGYPVVRFTGAPVKMTFSTTTEQTVFVVYKDNGTTDDYGDLLGCDFFPGACIPFHGNTVASGKLFYPVGTTELTNGTSWVDASSTAAMDIPVSASTHIYSFKPSAAIHFTNFAQNQGQATRFRKGDYAEVIAYTGLISASDRHSIESYLGSKYGITLNSAVSFTAGTISVSTSTASTVTVSSTDPDGGSFNYTYQWYRSTTSGFTPAPSNAIAGATSQTYTATGVTMGEANYYKLVYSDGVNPSLTSNELPVTLVPSSPFSLVVYADGDSVTSYPNNYTDFYATDVTASYPNITTTVTNVAVSGQTEAQMNADMQAQILANDPDVLTIATFLNDLGTDSATLTANIRSYIDVTLAHKNSKTGLPPQLILMTDNFSGQNLSEAYARPSALQQSTAATVLAAYNLYASNPNVHVVDNFQDFYDLGVDTPELYAVLLADMVHPNAAGYEIFHGNFTASLTAAAARASLGSVTAPVISSVVATPGSTTSTVTWTTEDFGSSMVNYGPNTAYGTTSTEADTSTRVMSHSVSLTGLPACTTLHYRPRSNDSFSNLGSGADATFTTTGCTGSAAVTASSTADITTAAGGSTNLLSGATGITLTAPAGFSGTDATFQIKQLDAASVLATAPAPSGYSAIGSYVYSLEAVTSTSTLISTFDAPITVSVAYASADVSGIDESTMRIYRWNGSIWDPLSGCSVSTGAVTVTCTTTQFSTFGLFGQAAAAVSTRGGGDVGAPQAPAAGFAVAINAGAASTTSTAVTLALTGGPDTATMAISNSADFTNIGQETYAPTKYWNLCQGLSVCEAGNHSVYVRFYTAGGGGSGTYADTILLTAAGAVLESPTPPPANTPIPALLDNLQRMNIPVRSLIKLANDNNSKTTADAAVYYVGTDGKRHAFPNERVYFTWYADFTGIRIVNTFDLASIPLGENVTYKPGVRLVKFLTDPKVYAVASGGLLRWITSELIAATIYGADWNQMVDDVNDVLFGNYTFGADITSSADYNPTAAAASVQYPGDGSGF